MPKHVKTKVKTSSISDEPNMSDTTVLVTVEDLISRAMGPPNANSIDFNLVKMILEIYARQQRILLQKIEIKIAEMTEKMPRMEKFNLSKDADNEEIQDDSEEKENVDKKQKRAVKETQKGKKERKKQEKIDNEKAISKAQKKVDQKKTSDEMKFQINITEKQIDDEKILVIERGPSTCLETQTSSTINFVTMSQFAVLEAAVEELKNIAPPMQIRLSGKEDLIKNMMKGTVSLPEAMDILQVKEKMSAAEKSMANIVNVLTQLVATDALPHDIAGQMDTLLIPLYEEMIEEIQDSQLIIMRKSVALDPKATQSQTTQTQATKHQPTQTESLTTRSPERGQVSRPFFSPEPSMVSKFSIESKSFFTESSTKVPCVTFNDMRAFIKDLKDDITKILNRLIGKTTAMIENAVQINKTIASKVKIAQNLYNHVTTVYTHLEDYINQFTGLDSILSSQLQNVKDQIAQMHKTLQSGLDQMTVINNSAEAEAVTNLLERTQEMDVVLDTVLYEIKGLVITQAENRAQMQIMMETLKMMQKEKSDRDEFRDTLPYKAASSELVGKMKYVEFANTYENLEHRIDNCHEIFHRSIDLWAEAIKNLKTIKGTKANFIELLTTREELENQLQALNNKIKIVTSVIGDPQVALTSRNLAVDATCGSCHEPARMDPVDASSGVPPRLPPLRKEPEATTDEHCISKWIKKRLPDTRHDICRRWCGGSHTVVSEPTKCLQLHVQVQAIPTRHYADYGDDGRLYMCEEALQPCVECNTMGAEKNKDQAH